MSVKAALYRYLTEPGDLTGPAAIPFSRPRIVSGLTIKNRNDARRWLRDRVGSSIYSGRRPMKPSEHTQIYLRTSFTEQPTGLTGEIDGRTELVEAAIICRKADAPARCEVVADLLSLCVGGWGGGYWGDTYVGECLVDGRTSRTYSPVDGSDDWLHEVQLGLDIIYIDEATAQYAADGLRAVIAYLQNPGVDGIFRVSALQSVIPEGRTLASVAWNIRQGDASGASLISLSGAANAVVSTANVSGTFGQPSIDRVAYGITGPVWVSLTITDSFGEQSTFAEARDET